jgi:formyl-CoA transferase
MLMTEVRVGRKTWLDAPASSATAAWSRPPECGDRPADPTARKRPANPLAGASYKTADNRWLLLALVEGDKTWPGFTKAIGREDLAADARFGTEEARAANAQVLVAELARAFEGKPLVYWKLVLTAARLPYGIVQALQETAN